MLHKDGVGSRMYEKGKRQGWRMIAAEVLVVAAICLGAAGCGDGSEDPFIDEVLHDKNLEVKFTGLKGFDSCDEMDGEMRELFVAGMESQFDQMKGRCRGGSAGSSGDATDATGGDIQDATVDNPSYTGTNVQEAGIDESDLMKTDGTHVYSIVGASVNISRAWPFEKFGKLATISPKGNPYGLYLHGNRLVVLSTFGQQVFVEIYDVSVPGGPRPVKSQSYRGDLNGSRMAGPVLHLIIGRAVVGPTLDYSVRWNNLPECPGDGSRSKPNSQMISDIGALRERNMEAIAAYRFSDGIPAESGADRASLCRDFTRSHLSMGSNLLSVVSQDINSEDGPNTASIAGASGTVYVSPDNIYVAEQYHPIDRMFAEGLEDRTVIHRFSIAERIPKYSDTASVAGHVVGSRYSDRFSMSQFSMSEHEGHLRVATTVSADWQTNTPSESRVIVLSLDTGMPVSGEVTGLGLGESIYAVRFMGDRGYVVTFKQIDPFYVIDLSDPANPFAAGELKVPGFSTYLHPMADGRIIGLGFDADDQGSFAWFQGLKLAMFDVSDAANPIEAAKLLLGSRGTSSAATSEHHAFTFDAGRGIVALPIDLYEGTSGGSAYGQHVKLGVELIGIGDDGSFNAMGEVVIKEFSGSYGSYNGWTQVLRTIIIGDGVDEGVITLTSDNVYLHRIDDEMTKVGAIN